MLQARCVVEALARGTAPAPLRCPYVDCEARHPRRDTLEAAVHTDSDLRNRAARIGRETLGDEDLRSRGLWYGWDQNSLGIGPPLDAVSSEDLGQRFAAGKTVQPQLAGAHARLTIYALGILNHAMGQHRPNRDSTTPKSFPRAIKLWYLMPAVFRSPDGRIKRRQRFVLLESGDAVLLLPWLIAYTKREGLIQRDAAQEASEEAKLERASSACRHAGGVKSGSIQPSGRTTISGERGNVEHIGGQVPPRRPCRRVHGGGGSAGERHRGGRWKRPPVAP